MTRAERRPRAPIIEFIGSTTGAQAGDAVELSFAGSGFGDIDHFGDAAPRFSRTGHGESASTGVSVPDFFPVGNGEDAGGLSPWLSSTTAGNRSDPVMRTMVLDETPPEVTIDTLESDGQALGAGDEHRRERRGSRDQRHRHGRMTSPSPSTARN